MRKIVIQDKFKSPPYSLHDAHLLNLIPDKNAICLHFQYGYLQTTAPYGQVNGDVEITGLDWDFCCAYVMEYTQVRCGNCGSFIGRKMTIQDFLKGYANATVDVMDEVYGYNQVKISGFLNHGRKCDEVQLEFYYTGEFRYLIENETKV